MIHSMGPEPDGTDPRVQIVKWDKVPVPPHAAGEEVPEIGSEWIWEPKNPRAFEYVRVIDVRVHPDGGVAIQTEAINRSNRTHWNSLDVFREACIPHKSSPPASQAVPDKKARGAELEPDALSSTSAQTPSMSMNGDTSDRVPEMPEYVKKSVESCRRGTAGFSREDYPVDWAHAQVWLADRVKELEQELRDAV